MPSVTLQIRSGNNKMEIEEIKNSLNIVDVSKTRIFVGQVARAASTHTIQGLCCLA